MTESPVIGQLEERNGDLFVWNGTEWELLQKNTSARQWTYCALGLTDEEVEAQESFRNESSNK